MRKTWIDRMTQKYNFTSFTNRLEDETKKILNGIARALTTLIRSFHRFGPDTDVNPKSRNITFLRAKKKLMYSMTVVVSLFSSPKRPFDLFYHKLHCRTVGGGKSTPISTRVDRKEPHLQFTQNLLFCLQLSCQLTMQESELPEGPPEQGSVAAMVSPDGTGDKVVDRIETTSGAAAS